MTAPMTKHALLEQLQAARNHWEHLVAEVGEARMEVPALGNGWTFKDLTAHLTTWWRREVYHLVALIHGEQLAAFLAPAQVETVNTWVWVVNRDRPLADVLHDARTVWNQLEATLSALPEQELFDPQCRAWIDGGPLGPGALTDFTGHLPEEHEPDVRAWLNAPQ